MALPDSLDDDALSALDEDVRGSVLRAGDPGYEDARTLWNARIDLEPALVVRCHGSADVVNALAFARTNNLPLSVKGTGHNVAGTALCDDGLVIDLGPMDAVEVDPDMERARVQPGATWGDFDHETQAFGLATPGAQAPGVGVVGATLGGGIGWLSRKYGLTVDNLVSADVVTADGNLIRASPEENPGLFWALRGGSGNVGIVTSMRLRLHEVGPQVLAGSLIHPLEDARAVIARASEFATNAPTAVTTLVSVLKLPSAPHIPAEKRDEHGVLVALCFEGDVDRGEEILAPLREFGDPIADTIRRRPYKQWQTAGRSDDSARTYHDSHYFERLSTAAIDTLVEYASDVPSSDSAIYFVAHDGAVTEVPSEATAYPHRAASFLLVIEARWDDGDDERHIRWARECSDALRPYATGGTWVNALTDTDAERVEAAYGDNYERLATVKQRWDPENVFRRTHTVEPAG